MASRGRGRRGGGRGNNQPPPAFDQRAFMEAVGAATAVENQAYVASCLCMFLSIFRILFSFFNFPELMEFIVIITVIITVIIIFDLESF